MGKNSRREKRIASLKRKQAAERERERADRDTDAPVGLQTPLKPHREGEQPQADLYDEYFGGFDRHESGREYRRPGAPWWSGDKSSWNRVWGRVDVHVERFERDDKGKRVAKRVLWQAAPKHWAAKQGDLLDQIIDGEREARLRHPCGVAGEGIFPKGISSTAFICEWMEAKIYREFRPSRRLEAKRFPKLPKIKTKLLPKEGPGKAERRALIRELIEKVTTAFILDGPGIAECPPEWTTRDLNAIAEKYENRERRGRPPEVLGRAMTPAERKRRERNPPRVVLVPAQPRLVIAQREPNLIAALPRRLGRIDATATRVTINAGSSAVSRPPKPHSNVDQREAEKPTGND